jgi:hypothetical protein
MEKDFQVTVTDSGRAVTPTSLLRGLRLWVEYASIRTIFCASTVDDAWLFIQPEAACPSVLLREPRTVPPPGFLPSQTSDPVEKGGEISPFVGLDVSPDHLQAVLGHRPSIPPGVPVRRQGASP